MRLGGGTVAVVVVAAFIMVSIASLNERSDNTWDQVLVLGSVAVLSVVAGRQSYSLVSDRQTAVIRRHHRLLTMMAVTLVDTDGLSGLTREIGLHIWEPRGPGRLGLAAATGVRFTETGPPGSDGGRIY